MAQHQLKNGRKQAKNEVDPSDNKNTRKI